MSQSNLKVPGKNDTKPINERENSQSPNIEASNTNNTKNTVDSISDSEYDDFGFGDTIYF